MINSVKRFTCVKKTAKDFGAMIHVARDNQFDQRCTESGRRARFEAKLEGVGTKKVLILGQDDMFNNFTQGGGKSNRSVVLAARVIFMVFRNRDQDAIPNTFRHITMS